jgi:hypothetical protein
MPNSGFTHRSQVGSRTDEHNLEPMIVARKPHEPALAIKP